MCLSLVFWSNLQGENKEEDKKGHIPKRRKKRKNLFKKMNKNEPIFLRSRHGPEK
jgi:hypothetical protein